MQEPYAGKQKKQHHSNKTIPQGNRITRNIIREISDKNLIFKNSCIIAMKPKYFGVLKENDKVFGCMEVGFQEESTKLQEGGTEGGTFLDVMHEGLYTDNIPDFRAPDNSRNKKL